MKNFLIILLIIITIFTISCKDASDNSGSSTDNVNISPITLQKEMLDILERNITNPKNALKELDKYYEKYSKILKRNLKKARAQNNNSVNEYNENLSEKEKLLLKKQKQAVKKILKIEPNFNAKLMILMKKHGLLG